MRPTEARRRDASVASRFVVKKITRSVCLRRRRRPRTPATERYSSRAPFSRSARFASRGVAARITARASLGYSFLLNSLM